MPRQEIFVMRVNEKERREIKALATKLQRSQADAVRVVVREAAQQLEQAAVGAPPTGKAGSNDAN